MTRTRLRDARSAEAEAAYYARTYPDGYRHDFWPDHVERVAASVEMIRRYSGQIRTAADLSCGDGAIVRGIAEHLDEAWLGDLSSAPVEWGRTWGKEKIRRLPPGALPGSLWTLPEGVLPVDLYVLSETLEHMDDPDDLLRQLTGFSRYLFLSTPESEPLSYGNLEHYWSWSSSDIAEMLNDNGWTPLERRLLDPASTQGTDGRYVFQLWMAVHRG